MYDYVESTDKSNTKIVRNEISITNLIRVANNDRLFNTLDGKMKEGLLKIISAYTRGCVESIMKSNNSDAKLIQENIENKEKTGII